MQKIHWLFLFVIILFLILSSFIRFPLDYSLMDLQFLFATYSYAPSDFSSDIVMVVIDEYSEKQMRQTLESLLWRKTDPQVLEKLTTAGAKVIAYDMEFTGESTTYDEKLGLAF